MKGTRMDRINSEIQKHLAKIISEFDNLEISSTIVSILKVETFADFSLSKIYISVLGDENKKDRIVELLNENKKTIRYKLAHMVKFRNVPDLLFIADHFEQQSQRVLKLFEEIEAEDKNGNGGDSADEG